MKDYFRCYECNKEIKRKDLDSHREKNPYHRVSKIIEVFEIPKKITLKLVDFRILKDDEVLNRYNSNYRQADFAILVFESPYFSNEGYPRYLQYNAKEKDIPKLEAFIKKMKELINEDNKRKIEYKKNRDF